MKAIQLLIETSDPEDTAVAASSSGEDIAVAAVHRLDSTGVPVGLRLIELTENSIAARSLARSYLNIARKFLESVRHARATAQIELAEAYLREARRAHEQARKCLGFARLCERRAGAAPLADRWH